MNKKIAFGLTAFVLAGSFAGSAIAAKDHFDRDTLGKKWVVTDGNLFINNDAMQGDSLSLGYFKKSASDTTTSATVTLSGSGLQYGAVAVGDVATHNNAFVKIQSDDGLNFNNGGFYIGDNVPVLFFGLDSLIPGQATLTASMCGTVATMTIRSAAGKQKYAYDYGASFGSGGGLGTYGAISLDDYKSKTSAHCTVDRDAKMVTPSGARDLSLAK
jgi:hypothetical protein